MRLSILLSSFIPLGFFAGFAIGGKRPIVDISAFFQWNQFWRQGGGIGRPGGISAGLFHAGLAVKGYFSL